MSDRAVERARAYYRALDDHDYDALADLLADGFVHDRPDLTLDGCERFVAFMREERPQKDTTHRVEAVYRVHEDERGYERETGGAVAVRGRLLDADGEQITAFVDVFTVGDPGLERIDTYTH
ncbi:nuclear transport factor 2 family protein [Halosimplex salinum]|uniref:nuclear transport factor 2 family protein n=1 Tax=Halosimplex salinum TaxID=1710538 RepID=UPI000F48B48E|nr:nuclear transport factor 2 family protein [Halosimplex salinum]